ncbi:hypothetical protein ACLB2K_016527 [Fragaria x ananassa]
MLGGEKVIENVKPGTHWWLADFNLFNALCCDVFVLDLVEEEFSAAHQFPKPKGPKINARALAKIGDKVYVITFKPYYYCGGMIPHPAFECFDSAKQSWEELPPPLEYSLPRECFHHMASTMMMMMIRRRKQQNRKTKNSMTRHCL